MPICEIKAARGLLRTSMMVEVKFSKVMSSIPGFVGASHA